jgi:hypothetical protein
MQIFTIEQLPLGGELYTFTFMIYNIYIHTYIHMIDIFFSLYGIQWDIMWKLHQQTSTSPNELPQNGWDLNHPQLWTLDRLRNVHMAKMSKNGLHVWTYQQQVKYMKLWCIRGLNAFVTLFLEVLDLPLDATNIYTLVIKHGNGKICWGFTGKYWKYHPHMVNYPFKTLCCR